MAKSKKTILLSAIAILLIGSIGVGIRVLCAGSSPSELKNALQIYETALAGTSQAEATGYTVKITEDTTLFDTVFHMSSTKQISVTGGSAFIEETLTSGTNEVTITEIYQDSQRYITLSGCNFVAQEDADTFWQHHVPATPITAKNYSTVTGYSDATGYVITFTDATAPEPWMQTAANKLLKVEATVRIDKDYVVTSYTILAQFRQDEGVILQTTELSPAEPQQIPSPTETYNPIDDPEMLRALEISTGYLLQSLKFRSSYSETIQCQAFGDTRNRTIDIEADGTTQWDSLYKSTITTENSANAGSVTETVTTERYKDGKLTTTTDGQVHTSEEDPTAAQRRCRDLLVGTVIMPQFITNVTSSIDGNNIRYTITVNQEFDKAFSEEACATLYQDSGILSAYASDSSTLESGAYLAVSRRTYIPVASGFHYAGTYTISDLLYQLSFKADQLYNITG